MGINSLCVGTLQPWRLALGASDPFARIFDLRFLSHSSSALSWFSSSPAASPFTPPSLKASLHLIPSTLASSKNITGVAFNDRADELLVSYSGDSVHLFNVGNLQGLWEEHQPREENSHRVFRGHTNIMTVKEVNFFGPWVVSGSDDGNIFCWDKQSGELVYLLKGDSHAANCLQGHPLGYPMLVTSGIDNDVKVWEPIGTEENIAKVRQRIERLEEDNSDSLMPFASVIWNMLDGGFSEGSDAPFDDDLFSSSEDEEENEDEDEGEGEEYDEDEE